jgi:hypothetical protein
MSRLSSAAAEAIMLIAEDSVSRPKPVLVPTKRVDSADWVTRRVAEVVDQELANGSLPA